MSGSERKADIGSGQEQRNQRSAWAIAVDEPKDTAQLMDTLPGPE
jgi:hypothetical protein